VDAQYELGVMYDDGEGVAENDAEAVKWFRIAADQGNARAQLYLGLKYGKSEGVPESKVDAYFWWNLAAAQGDEAGRFHKGLIMEKMTREQIAEAQRRSAAWKPKKE
jgi:TPR repeat protein